MACTECTDLVSSLYSSLNADAEMYVSGLNAIRMPSHALLPCGHAYS